MDDFDAVAGDRPRRTDKPVLVGCVVVIAIACVLGVVFWYAITHAFEDLGQD